MSIKHIATLVSAGKHPVSDEPRHCRNDSLALTVGLELAKSASAQLEVLHAGNADNPALADYLALGATQVDVIPAAADADVVDSLAAKLIRTDLILTGSRAENGQDSGLLPYLLAAKLGLPLVANALAVKPTADGVEVLQFLPKGKRRRVTVQLPAVVAIHPLAPVELRYAYARQVLGKISALPVPAYIAYTAITASNDMQWQMQPAIRKPNKLKAHEKKAGHARMLSAIVSENKGGVVVNEGASVEKAQVILAYLREHRLINF
jgi:electron transfer flavoprotein beta subunit